MGGGRGVGGVNVFFDKLAENPYLICFCFVFWGGGERLVNFLTKNPYL